jgi:chemotaxis protein CheX
VTIVDHDVQRVVEDTWAALLDLAVQPISAGAPDPAGASPATVTATVGVEGAWSGRAQVSCSRRLALMFTGTMLGVRPDQVDDDALTDAIGELANVVTGNLKSLLPITCRLALPHVRTYPDSESAPPAGTVVDGSVVRFSCVGELLLVTFTLDPTPTAVGPAL